MRKYIILFLMFFAVYSNAFSQVEIYVKPSAVVFFPSSEQVKGYYDKNSIFTYGAEAYFITDFYGLGGFVNFSGYTVNLKDANQIEGEWKEKVTIVSFGLLKNFETPLCFINAKAGISFHSDELGFDNKDVRNGLRLGIDLTKELFPGVSLCLGGEYDYCKLDIPNYLTFVYSRHNAFFAGKTFSTGGYFLNAGISIKIL